MHMHPPTHPHIYTTHIHAYRIIFFARKGISAARARVFGWFLHLSHVCIIGVVSRFDPVVHRTIRWAARRPSATSCGCMYVA